MVLLILPATGISIALWLTAAGICHATRLLEAKRGGILNRIGKQIWPDGTYKAVQQLEPNVTFGTVSIFFVILLVGIILSILVLVVEKFWYKLRHVKLETEVSSFNCRNY